MNQQETELTAKIAAVLPDVQDVAIAAYTVEIYFREYFEITFEALQTLSKVLKTTKLWIGEERVTESGYCDTCAFTTREPCVVAREVVFND